MKPSYLYSVLLLLSLGIIAILGFTFSGPVIYSLETDLFPSLFHENTDALKVRSFNSTIDILPLMQDLLDYSGPIVLNINIRDMNQVKYYLDLFSKNNIKLKNLVVNLDMTESEMEEFSSDKLLQQKLLQELMDSTIAMDELDSLMVTYRDDNGMLISLKLQREAIMKRIRELSAEYEKTSEKIQKISEKIGLDTTAEKESVQEVKRIVEKMEEKTPVIKTPLPQIPTLSLLVKPETGKYGDSIGFSGFYSSGITAQERTTVTITIDSREVTRANTNQDGIYSSLFEIGQITPGEHTVVATSGIVSSGTRTFTVIPVNSTTSLYVLAVINKPEIQVMGEVRAGKQVRNAPVEIISDYRNILPQTTDKNGVYRTQIRLSPGTHHIQVRFVNDTYPIFSSKSPAYEVIAGPDSILGIRLLDADMGADELSLRLDPATVTYKDVINITGFLSGKDVKSKTVDLYIDGVYSRSLQTGPDGSYAGTYTVEKILAGNHTFFTHYGEPDVGEIYSEPRRIVVKTSESITTLKSGMTDGGTGVICTGNVTASGMGVSSVPVELVWDDRNSITIQTDATGSYRQKLSLPAGNHSIVARFTSPDYLPVKSSESRTDYVTILPPIDLYIKPLEVRYRDQLTLGGSLRGTDISGRDVQVFIDGKKLGAYRTGAGGNYSTQFPVETIPAGTHRVYARSGEQISDTESFAVLSVNSTITLSALLTDENTRVACSGQLIAAGDIPVRRAPVTLVVDGKNTVITTTDAQGRFEEMLSLPVGNHQIIARFENRELYPVQSSKSEPVNVEIVNPITVRVQPDQGVYLDTVTISGEMKGIAVSGSALQMYIDGKKTEEFRSDSRGYFTTPYTIQQIRGGVHTIQIRSGDIRSDLVNFTVAVVPSATTLSAERNSETSGVTCSGTVTANNKPVMFAPVVLVWDEKTSIRTTTDAEGKYHEIIVLPAGKHSIKAQFNSPDRFPINPSESAPVTIEIPQIISSDKLVLEVVPKEGRFMDHITIRGVHSNNKQIKPVSVSIDGKLQGTYPTNNKGEFFTEFIIEDIPAGLHTVYATSPGIQSQPETFTVLIENSTTTLSAKKIGETSLVSCTGTITGNDKPVRSAPVTLVWDGSQSISTITNEEGKYPETIALPAGNHQLIARFNSPDIFPLSPSESAPVDVEIPAPLTVTIQPGQGKYQDELIINGFLHTEGMADREVSIFIDDKQAGIYRTDNRGHFSTLFEIEKITGGQHTLRAISGDLKSSTVQFLVQMDTSTTTLLAERTGTTPEVVLSGTVSTNDRPVRAAPVTITWDGSNSLETSTDSNGAFRDSVILPAGVHRIQALFNSTDIFPINPSKSPLVEITISPGLSLDVRPALGIYQDTLVFEGTLIRAGTPESTVDLFMDNNLLAAAKTDSTGRYSYRMTIEQIPAGKHTVQARSADLSSGEKVFQALPVHSVTTLTIVPVNNSALYECDGSVMAFDKAGELIRKPLTFKDAEAILAEFWTDPMSRANRPVGFARVEIISNNDTLLLTMTDENGQFAERVTLPAGDNRVVARFINDSFPIFSSTSRKVDVNNPSANISVAGGARQNPVSITGPLVMAAVLLLFIGGAGIYLKQKTSFFSQKSAPAGSSIRAEIPPEQAADLASYGETRQSGDTSLHDLPTEDPIFVRYLRVLETEGLSTAARAVYVHFTATIAHKNPVRNHRGMTPREFVQSCREQPFITPFTSFISVYERIRYGGVKTPETKAEFEESVQETDRSLEGEDH